MYKVELDQNTNKAIAVYRNSDMAYIPIEPTNIDYQEYLDWLKQGNNPEIYTESVVLQ